MNAQEVTKWTTAELFKFLDVISRRSLQWNPHGPLRPGRVSDSRLHVSEIEIVIADYKIKKIHVMLYLVS